MEYRKILDEIESELTAAINKFPTWPTKAQDAGLIVAEESGELMKAILECTYEHPKSEPSDVRREAIQTAAMAIRFLLSFEQYEYTKSHQHEQTFNEGEK